jgi:heme exporter protein A
MMELAAENLACVRGGRRVFSGMNFHFRGGEAVAITGPNGAGKTTLLRLIAGLLPAEAGSLKLSGVSSGEEISACAHLVGHLDALKGTLTVFENLSFAMTLLGGGGQDVQPALDTLGLGHLGEIPARMLSAGQRRRLALARLLVSRRPLWLLDEPASALDAASQKVLFELIDRHTGEGGLALIATHAPLAVSNAREFSIGARAP